MRARVAFFAMSPLWLLPAPVSAQAPGVPVYDCCEREDTGGDKAVMTQARALREAGSLLDVRVAKDQLSRTARIQAELPPKRTRRLPARAIWRIARASYLRIGIYYLCHECSEWHLNLSGGYVIAQGGIAATCHHVIANICPKVKQGYLVAVDDQGKVYPVLEVLTAQIAFDSAIVRTGAVGLPALPMDTEVRPGDHAYLFSDPEGRRGYFSEGMVNRFVHTIEAEAKVVRMNVGTDWAPGSSGAALLDVHGNAIGHVSSLATLGHGGDASERSESHLVLHNAVRAADVLSLFSGPPSRGSRKSAPRGERP
jgi:hypothetical protein